MRGLTPKSFYLGRGGGEIWSCPDFEEWVEMKNFQHQNQEVYLVKKVTHAHLVNRQN